MYRLGLSAQSLLSSWDSVPSPHPVSASGQGPSPQSRPASRDSVPSAAGPGSNWAQNVPNQANIGSKKGQKLVSAGHLNTFTLVYAESSCLVTFEPVSNVLVNVWVGAENRLSDQSLPSPRPPAGTQSPVLAFGPALSPRSQPGPRPPAGTQSPVPAAERQTGPSPQSRGGLCVPWVSIAKSPGRQYITNEREENKIFATVHSTF